MAKQMMEATAKLKGLDAAYGITYIDENGDNQVFLLEKLNHNSLRIFIGQLKIGKHWNLSKYMMHVTLANALNTKKFR
jgi:hypothetical protein